MSKIAAFLDEMIPSIADASARIGERVILDHSVLDRSDSIALAEPGLWSANRSCRMVQARDGWIAANLPREDDLASIPALLSAEPNGDAWAMLTTQARDMTCAELTSRAELLGLALAQVGEVAALPSPCGVDIISTTARRRSGISVIDFSSLWAGPQCGAVFAAIGADVVKIEAEERPDHTPQTAPLLDRRLNGAKRRQRISITSPDARARLLDQIATADVLITSARARALTALGLKREHLFAANPSLIWIAITGHGWRSNRIAFGDDAAAAGGLVAWRDGAPHFIGDALADPLTGIAAAAAALAALERGECAFIDATLAHVAAHVAGLTP